MNMDGNTPISKLVTKNRNVYRDTLNFMEQHRIRPYRPYVIGKGGADAFSNISQVTYHTMLESAREVISSILGQVNIGYRAYKSCVPEYGALLPEPTISDILLMKEDTVPPSCPTCGKTYD